MAEPFGVHFEVTGPVFDGTGLRAMQGIVNRGLLDIAKLTFRNRDLGAVGSIGAGEMSITAAEGEVRSVLMSLEDFRVTGTSNGIIF